MPLSYTQFHGRVHCNQPSRAICYKLERKKNKKKERILHLLNLLNFISPICKAISALTVAFRAEEFCLRQIQPRQKLWIINSTTPVMGPATKAVDSEKQSLFWKEAELQKWVISERLHGKGCVCTSFALFPLNPMFALTAQEWDSPFCLWRYTCSTGLLNVELNVVHSRAATGTKA